MATPKLCAKCFVKKTSDDFHYNKKSPDRKAYYCKPCFYCNGSLGTNQAGTGLDRINNKFGYFKSNIVSCCRVCNMVKGHNFDAQETCVMVKALLEFRGNHVVP